MDLTLPERKELVRGRKLYKGTLADYPELQAVLAKAGHVLPLETKASVLKALCKSLTAPKPTPKRGPTMNIKLSDAELELIRQRAALRKVKPSAYVRQVAVRAARFDWGF